jgi:hypothetical protein
MRLVLAAIALALLAACSGSPPANNQTAANSAVPATQAAPAGPAATPTPGATVFLPTPGAHPARAMTMSVPPEAEALAARMTTAIRDNFAWYRAYAAQHPQGELPWHPNLGLSEAEYARFQTLTAQISLRETARVTLNVTRRPDGGLALAVAGPAAPLDGIILYPERGRIETPLGPLGNGAATANRQARSPTGPWEGVRWTNLGSGAPRRVALAFGRRAQGDMLIFYDYGPTDAETVILLYPAAGPPPAAAAR